MTSGINYQMKFFRPSTMMLFFYAISCAAFVIGQTEPGKVDDAIRAESPGKVSHPSIAFCTESGQPKDSGHSVVASIQNECSSANIVPLIPKTRRQMLGIIRKKRESMQKINMLNRKRELISRWISKDDANIVMRPVIFQDNEDAALNAIVMGNHDTVYVLDHSRNTLPFKAVTLPPGLCELDRVIEHPQITKVHFDLSDKQVLFGVLEHVTPNVKQLYIQLNDQLDHMSEPLFRARLHRLNNLSVLSIKTKAGIDWSVLEWIPNGIQHLELNLETNNHAFDGISDQFALEGLTSLSLNIMTVSALDQTRVILPYLENLTHLSLTIPSEIVSKQLETWDGFAYALENVAVLKLDVPFDLQNAFFSYKYDSAIKICIQLDVLRIRDWEDLDIFLGNMSAAVTNNNILDLDVRGCPEELLPVLISRLGSVVETLSIRIVNQKVGCMHVFQINQDPPILRGLTISGSSANGMPRVRLESSLHWIRDCLEKIEFFSLKQLVVSQKCGLFHLKDARPARWPQLQKLELQMITLSGFDRRVWFDLPSLRYMLLELEEECTGGVKYIYTNSNTEACIMNSSTVVVARDSRKKKNREITTSYPINR